MNVGSKTVRGVFWTYLSFAAGKIVTLATTIILARLLVPAQFGQVAIALLAISYLDVLGDLGISAALIYQRHEIERAAHVAFSLSITIGLALSGLTALSAPAI